MNKECETYKDMYGNPIYVGNLVTFENNDSFKKYRCPEYFIGKQWEISFIGDCWITVVDGHIPGDTYEWGFPLDCVQLVNNFEEIPSEMVGNILL